MNRKHSSLLAVSLLLTGQMVCGAFTARAGDFDLKSTVDPDSKGSSDSGEGNFLPKKLRFTFDSRVGYDDNTLAQPDLTFSTTNPSTGQVVRQHESPTSSAFINFDLGANYTATTSRSALSIGGDVGVSYYFDRPGRSYDVNGGLSGTFTYKLTPRLFLQASTYNAYVSDGDYGASNITNFNGSEIGGVRAPGTTDNRNGDYFYTSDTLTLTLQLTPRISLATGYAITAFAYDSDPYSTIDDRVEQFISEEFRYLLLPNLTLAADYRFGYVDYFSVNNNSYTNFLLGGVDYVFNPRLRGGVRAGVEFRVYPDANGNEVSPYGEATITYNVSRLTSADFIARYGIEEGGLTADPSNSDTIRLGISLNQQITARVSGYLSFYYTHSFYDNPDGNIANFSEDTFDVALGGRYAINRNLSLEVGYTHTTVTSEEEGRGYNRNRVFGGVRLAF